MKTIAFGKSQPSVQGNSKVGTLLFVLAALGGLYYLRRSGKSISQILASGTEGLQTARGFINRFAPPVVGESLASSANSITSGARH